MSKKNGRNTFAKRSREMEKKRKAQQKLTRRNQRRDDRGATVEDSSPEPLSPEAAE